MTFGWKPSIGTLGIEPFIKNGNIVKMASFNANEYIIPEYTAISNQLNIGSCVGNSVADMFEILYGLENTNVFQISRLFIYWNARLKNKDTDKDDGCYIHHAMESLKNIGVCRESTWPYDIGKVFTQPSIIAYKEGDDNTINNFFQITSFDEDRLDDIELSIRGNHPVVFGTQVGNELQNYIGGNDYVFNLPKKSIGGHAMLIVGVRTNNGKREFLIRNSWGNKWGLKSYPGHAWFSGDYLKADETADLFVGTRMDNLLI